MMVMGETFDLFGGSEGVRDIFNRNVLETLGKEYLSRTDLWREQI